MKHFLALLLLAPLLALAAPSATVSWVPSVTHADGTPLTGPVTFNVYQQGPTIGGVQSPYGLVLTGITANSVTLSTGLPASGSVCFEVTEIETATGLESASSIAICKTIVAIAPSPPTGVAVK